MKYLLSLLLLLAGSVGAQDFPFFAKDAVSTPSTWTPQSVPGLSYWWNIEGLTNNEAVPTWTDKIQGNTLTSAGTGTPVNLTNNGISFGSVGGAGVRWYTNASRPYLGSNFVVGIIVSNAPMPTPGNVYMSASLVNEILSNGTRLGYKNEGTEATPYVWIPSIESSLSGAYFATNWQDVVITFSNTIASPDCNIKAYTNGSYSGLYQSLGDSSQRHWYLRTVGGDEQNLYSTLGRFAEFCIWTNVNDATAWVSNWHNYRTNKYGP